VKRFCLLACLVGILAAPVAAQNARLDDRLPATTTFYMYWRGAASTEAARGTNPLLRMWADPEFAPAREAMFAEISRDAKDKLTAALTQNALLSLLENPLVFGTANRGQATPKLAAPGPTQKPLLAENSFLIYDATGKKALVESLLELEASDTTTPPKITRSAFGHTKLESVAGSKETYYRAFAGNYFLRAGRKDVLEELLLRLENSDATPALRDVADYQQARRITGEQASFEFFMRTPDLTPAGLPISKDFDAQAGMKALGLEKLRAICGGLTFAADATRTRMAVLGDTSPGGPFDLVGESAPSFATLAAAPAGMVSYAVNRFDFLALYQLVRKAAEAVFATQQAGVVEGIESMAATAMGMSVAEALGLFTGQVASFSDDLGMDPFANFYAAGIRKPEEVLQLLRVLLSKEIHSEDREGEVTYLSVTTSFRDARTGAPRKRFQYIGVTPQLLVVAPRKTTLREMVRQLASKAENPATSGLAGEHKFAAARARLAADLSGLSYADLSRIQWDAQGEAIEQQVKSTPGTANSTATRVSEWRKRLPPALLQRYLHTAYGGWWKGPDGLHFDGFID